MIHPRLLRTNASKKTKNENDERSVREIWQNLKMPRNGQRNLQTKNNESETPLPGEKERYTSQRHIGTELDGEDNR